MGGNIKIHGTDGIDRSSKVSQVLVSVGGALHTFNESGLKQRVDEQSTYTYIGRASPGSATSADTWQIKRITNASGDIDWADGNIDFDNVWDDRAGLSYS